MDHFNLNSVCKNTLRRWILEFCNIVLVIETSTRNLSFSERHKIANIGNFVFPYICSFLPNLHQMMLVNVKSVGK